MTNTKSGKEQTWLQAIVGKYKIRAMSKLATSKKTPERPMLERPRK